MSAVRVSMAVTGVLLAGVAMASPPSYARYERRASSEYEYAPVTHVEPIVRQVRVETPSRECYDDVRYVEDRPHISDPEVGGRTLIGGIIGGVIGHQIGSGRGRDAATVAGATIGAAVGYDAAARRSASVREEIVQRCETRYEKRYEERVDGYRVTYEYNGREYTTRLPYDPGERIRVKVAVAVAE
ncbi:glycine zipper 2TM domain-containing protein [Steroidobacter sp.]|uniref:glycine zipper 2TM domain-containing protein n=1 Tax=Steroidobacter sp. TaxID=1978227 RepID=UPI0025CEEA1A|nr:glycine zipper 2TM domain-containing protein [Steroidobacter sp.]